MSAPGALRGLGVALLILGVIVAFGTLVAVAEAEVFPNRARTACWVAAAVMFTAGAVLLGATG